MAKPKDAKQAFRNAGCCSASCWRRGCQQVVLHHHSFRRQSLTTQVSGPPMAGRGGVDRPRPAEALQQADAHCLCDCKACDALNSITNVFVDGVCATGAPDLGNDTCSTDKPSDCWAVWLHLCVLARLCVVVCCHCTATARQQDVCSSA